MTFAGRFADSLVVEQLDKISVSFLAETLEIRRGGVAGNICFGMASLGQRPILVGAAGEDFADYRSWLTRHGVDCDHVHISTTKHTARFVCTTDDDMAPLFAALKAQKFDTMRVWVGENAAMAPIPAFARSLWEAGERFVEPASMPQFTIHVGELLSDTGGVLDPEIAIAHHLTLIMADCKFQ